MRYWQSDNRTSTAVLPHLRATQKGNLARPHSRSPQAVRKPEGPAMHCHLHRGDWSFHLTYQQDIEKLERVQRQAARFITKDYRTREPGCVNRMLQDLNLPPQAESRRQARLGLMYKITGGLIPAKSPQNYLTPVSASRRRIRPTKYEDFEATNIIDRHEVRNTRSFQLPAYNTKQYQNSFFVRTVVDWNHLEENIVKAGSASAFTSALSRSTPPAS